MDCQSYAEIPPKRDYGRYFCSLARKEEPPHRGLMKSQAPFSLYRKLRFWVAQKEHMVIEHMLYKHVFGHDNKTLAGSEDIETFFAKTIVKWIIFI